MDIQVLYYVLAVILVLVGLAGTVLPAIPGLPLMFAGMFLGAWAGGFEEIGAVTLTALGILTVLALAMDFWVTAMGAKRVGASKQAVIGASIGTFVGLFFGIFAGAAIGELQHQRHLGQAARVGVGTWIGLLFGVVLKLALAFTMIGTFVLAWIF